MQINWTDVGTEQLRTLNQIRNVETRKLKIKEWVQLKMGLRSCWRDGRARGGKTL